MNTVHSVFGVAPPPGSYGLYNDATPIKLGSCFYVVLGVEGAACTGGRLWIPEGVNVPPNVTIEARHNVTTSANNLDTPALRSVTTSIPAGPGWLEVTWAPFSVLPGEYVLISYSFVEAPQDYLYSAPSTLSYIYANDGAPMVMAEGTDGGGLNRSYFRYNSGPHQATNSFYAVDVLMDIPRTGKVKVWTGTAWQACPLKIWDGATWVTKKAQGFDGTEMVEGK